jgi:hypothetical protein
VVIPDFIKQLTSDRTSLESELNRANQTISLLQSQLEAKNRELSTVRAELNKTRDGKNQSVPPPEVDKPRPTAEETATKISIWESVSTVNLSALVIAYNKIDEALSKWPDLIKSQEGRVQLNQTLVNGTAAYVAASNDIETLGSAFKAYPEVSVALVQRNRNDLLKASADFSSAVINGNTDFSSSNYANKLRPLAGALRREMTTSVHWFDDLRKTATEQLKELSK